MRFRHLSTLRRLAFSVGVIGLFTVGSLATASAQDIINEEHGVTIQPPKDWEETRGNEKAVAVFTHPSTQSQIEVVPTKLMTADVADVFFSTFHKTLTESNFTGSASEDKTYGTVSGKLYTYSFSHSGVNLEVRVFQFVKDTTAWLIVGYMQKEESADVLPAFEGTIEKLTFKK
jgi:hypothetical protein